MTRFKKSRATGRLGANFVERVALAAGCSPVMYSADAESGLDGHIELVLNEEATGQLVGFQVKAGPSYWRNGAPYVQTDQRHLAYWYNHDLPVLLIVVSADSEFACWMDIKAYIEKNQDVLRSGPYALCPPVGQRFDVRALRESIRRLAISPDFGAAVQNLCSPSAEKRFSGLRTILAFRKERRAFFALVAALVFESDIDHVREVCAALSRCLPHPESSFCDIPGEIVSYFESLLAVVPGETLVRVLGSFRSDDFDFAGPGVLEIFGMSDDEIWDPYDIFERGSIEQSMAVVAECIGRGRFAKLLRDETLDISVRCAAVAFYAYANDTGLTVDDVRVLMNKATDDSLRAWLYWLQFWVNRRAS